MNPIISQAIADLELEELRIRKAIDALRRLTVANATSEPQRRSRRPRKLFQADSVAKREPRKLLQADGNGRSAQPATVADADSGQRPFASPNSTAIYKALRSIPEPFTAESLAVASGVENKAAANAITRWKDKGWVENTGETGEYRRGAKMPL